MSLSCLEKLTRRSIPRKGIYKVADIFLYEVGCFILSGIDKEGGVTVSELAAEMDRNGDYGIPVPGNDRKSESRRPYLAVYRENG